MNNYVKIGVSIPQKIILEKNDPLWRPLHNYFNNNDENDGYSSPFMIPDSLIRPPSIVKFIENKQGWADYVLEVDAQEDLKGNLRFCVIDTNGIYFYSIKGEKLSQLPQIKIELILTIEFVNIIRIYYSTESCYELGWSEVGGRFIIETNNEPIIFCTNITKAFKNILNILKKFMNEDKIIEKPFDFKISSKSLKEQIKAVEERKKKSFGRKIARGAQSILNLGRRAFNKSGGAKRKRSSKKRGRVAKVSTRKRGRVATKKRVNRARVQSKKRKSSTKSRNYKRKRSSKTKKR
jgi:hypothetical protein